MVLNLDLNCPPHDEDSSMNVNTTLELGLPCAQMRTSYEPDDDDVIICSPRSFADVRIPTTFHFNTFVKSQRASCLLIHNFIIGCQQFQKES